MAENDRETMPADTGSKPLQSSSAVSIADQRKPNLERKTEHNSRRGSKRSTRNQRGNGRGGSRGQGRRQGGERAGRQNRDTGRREWSRNPVDKRSRNDAEQIVKRRKIELNGEDATPTPFSKEEIAAEERKPKRKVAVLIGYAGSGYKGMQINSEEKTIEGDLFSAFIAAGAISKANANDPKKSSLVRCARTDKGVHAAGNVISLKLIVEDPDIVAKVNEALPPQIRVWGFERTNGSFSCYQTCDSRWYEYLIPTYSFLPPHPQSFLGKQLIESGETNGVLESLRSRQEDVGSFWEQAEKTYINPILENLDPVARKVVLEVIHSSEEGLRPTEEIEELSVEDNLKALASGDYKVDKGSRENGDALAEPTQSAECKPVVPSISTAVVGSPIRTEPVSQSLLSALTPAEAAIKDVKAAYIRAKKAYRISTVRRQRIQDALSEYVGTQNFHNYTIQKTFRDPSAKRVIRSFKIASEPIIINDTEWLSLKVHGQSFMMHQIRKMVAMVALVIRCGCPLERIRESYGPDRISIPKAPGLGLLLEKPVFNSYNERAVRELQREKIDFDKFNKEIEEFKQREIYERIFREENSDHYFHNFFHHVDHYHTNAFLWVTSTGIPAATTPLLNGDHVSKGVNKEDLESDGDGNAGDEDG